ncbi:MAG: hypothetical protein ABH879_06780 [archaeon]
MADTYRITVPSNPVIDYLFHGDPVADEAIRRHNERFRHPDMQITPNEGPLQFRNAEGQVAAGGANLAKTLSINQMLRETSDRRIPTLVELAWYRGPTSSIKNGVIFADTTVVPKEEGQDWEYRALRERVLEIIMTDDPAMLLLLCGMGVVPADNRHGFDFAPTEYLSIGTSAILEAGFDIDINGEGTRHAISNSTHYDSSGLCEVLSMPGRNSCSIQSYSPNFIGHPNFRFLYIQGSSEMVGGSILGMYDQSFQRRLRQNILSN